MDYSKASIRNEIGKRLITVIENYQNIMEAKGRMNSIGADVSLKDDLDDFILKTLYSLIRSIQDDLTRRYSQNTRAEASITFRFTDGNESRLTNNSLLSYEDSQYINEHHLNTDTLLIWANEFMDRINYDDLLAQIEVARQSLHDEGLKLAIGDLIDFLEIHYETNWRPSAWKRGRLICDGHAVGFFDRHDYERNLNKAVQAARIIEQETDICLSNTLRELQLKCQEINYNQSLEPGTYGKGLPLEVRVFKSKITYRLSKEAVDALTAFATLHGDARQMELMQNIVDMQNEDLAA